MDGNVIMVKSLSVALILFIGCDGAETVDTVGTRLNDRCFSTILPLTLLELNDENMAFPDIRSRVLVVEGSPLHAAVADRGSALGEINARFPRGLVFRVTEVVRIKAFEGSTIAVIAWPSGETRAIDASHLLATEWLIALSDGEITAEERGRVNVREPFPAAIEVSCPPQSRVPGAVSLTDT